MFADAGHHRGRGYRWRVRRVGRAGRPLDSLRQSKVKHLDGTVFRQRDIRRFQIPMDDALAASSASAICLAIPSASST